MPLVSGCFGNRGPDKDLASKPIEPKVPPKAPKLVQPEVASYHVRREVSMIYRLDLLKDNAHSPAVAAAMKKSEDRFRACYTDRLGTVPSLAGDLALSFQLNRTSGIQKVTRDGGSLNDLTLYTCLSQRLSEVAFRPPYDMRGRLHYQFSVTERKSGPATTLGTDSAASDGKH